MDLQHDCEHGDYRERGRLFNRTGHVRANRKLPRIECLLLRSPTLSAGTNWYAIYGIEDQTGNIPVPNYTAAGSTTAHSFLINVAGWNQFRLRVYSTTVQSGDLVAAFTPQTASCTQFVGSLTP